MSAPERRPAATSPEWTEHLGPGPLCAVAVHAGGAVRPELVDRFALPRAERLREEDPFTDRWAALVATRLIGERSRFEVDLNRPLERAVYLGPADAWGLGVWHDAPTAEEVAASRAIHARFYERLGEVLDQKVMDEGGFVLLDFHSYNHRRAGPEGPPADPDENPEINIGTGTLDREFWGPLIDRFLADLRGNSVIPDLDVRENVKFRGGYVPLWTHAHYPRRGVALAIEFKKTFMDEWAGEPDDERIEALAAALRETLPGLRESLGQVLSKGTR